MLFTEKPATDNLVQHGFSRPQNMPMSHDSKQNLLPGGATISKNSPHISDWPLDQIFHDCKNVNFQMKIIKKIIFALKH